jgi:hypothetical protein
MFIEDKMRSCIGNWIFSRRIEKQVKSSVEITKQKKNKELVWLQGFGGVCIKPNDFGI